jgi:hypothetical protein
MKKQLYILPDFKTIGDYLKFEGEDDNRQLCNVEFHIDDFIAFLGVSSLDTGDDGIDWSDHAQDIYDAWKTGKTLYDVRVYAKKHVGYRFFSMDGGSNNVCKNVVGDPDRFLKNNVGYHSYEPTFQ